MSIIQLRRDTTANWLSVNPVLAQGELGIAYNGDVVATIRIGNGAATWTQLPDFGGNGDLTQAAADLLYATLAQGELADTAVQPGDLPTFGDVVTHNASEFATAAQGTDARTPTAHAASHATAGTDPLTLAQSQVTGLTSDLAAKVGTSDPRLTDPRTPTSHAASHAAAGADPLTVAQSQVTNLGTDLAAKVPTSRTIAGLGLDADRSSADLKTALTLVKGDVGLGNVDNTADADKPVSTLQAAADSAAVAAAASDATTKADAKVADAINDGTTTVAPSQNAVFDALALKVPTSRTIAGLDLSADRTAAGLRTALSLVPGTDVQAYDADLGQIAAATFSNDDFVQKKAGSLTNRTIAQVKTDLGIGGVATDAIFDAKGDLPVGTGADAAAKLTVGADGSSLTADSSAAAGVAWLGAVSIKAPKTADGGIHTPETTMAGGANSQSAANAQVATWFPCWVHKPVRPLLRSYCFTLEAGSSARFALWTLDHATIMPGTLIEDLGLMAGTSTGAKALSASTATVTGWFFLAVWASNHTTVRWGRPTFDSSKCQMFGTVGAAGGRNQYGWRAAGVDYSSAWNSTLPTLQAASDVDHGNPILPYWEYT